MTRNRIAIALLGAGTVAAAATAPAVAQNTGGARVELRCDRAGEPVDLRTCLASSELEISREGDKSAYTADDLATLGDPATGDLSLTMPHNFSVRAMNTSDSARLHLSVTTPSGRTVHEAEAGRHQYVQFYHCGPQVEYNCREYNYTPGKSN